MDIYPRPGNPVVRSLFNLWRNRNWIRSNIHRGFGAHRPDFNAMADQARKHRSQSRSYSRSRSRSSGRMVVDLPTPPRASKRGRSPPNNTGGVNKSRLLSRKKTGSAISRSSGFVGTGSKTTKSFRRSRRGKILKEGVSKTYEFGIVLNSTPTDQIASIGHVSTPLSQVKYIMWSAVIKLLLKKAGYCPISTTESLPFLANDKIYMQWRRTESTALADDTLTLVGGESFETIISYYTQFNKPWFDVSNQLSFNFIQFIPISISSQLNVMKVDMKNLRVKIESKSSFKFQNRTINTAGNDEADDVDNVPLYGMEYSGSGTGPQFAVLQQPSGLSFQANVATGLITPVFTNNYKNPVQPSMFQKVSKYGKVKLEPGEIKTSVLSYNKSNTFDYLHQQVNIDSQGSNQIRSTLGSFRLMILEKMLAATASGNIILACENNVYLAAVAYETRAQSTLEMYESTFL